MFVGASTWIKAAFEDVEILPGAALLDVGSSTGHFRTVEQPHIQENVMGPLEARGVKIVHLDAKAAEGVDVVCDLDTPGLDLAELLGRHFELVFCSGLLGFVRDPAHTAEVVREVVAPGGILLVDTPWSYRRTLDPRDNMLRPSPDELAKMFGAGDDFEVVRKASVPVDESSYYRGLKSRPMWIPVANRFWLPLPGFFERIRYRIPALRWKESLVVLRRRG
jgi:SAM-dependent methyltransferase